MIKAIIFDFFDVIHADPSKAWLKTHQHIDKNAFIKVLQELDRGDITTNEYWKELSLLSGQPFI